MNQKGNSHTVYVSFFNHLSLEIVYVTLLILTISLVRKVRVYARYTVIRHGAMQCTVRDVWLLLPCINANFEGWKVMF